MKKIGVIGKNTYSDGLFAIYLSLCSYIIYAEKCGYVPVVDLKHYQNQYFKDNREYRDNTWEYFFQQPAKITLDEIPTDSDIKIFGSNDYMVNESISFLPNDLPKSPNKPANIKYEKEFFNKLKFQPEIENFLTESTRSILGNEKNVLGILYRGTDYLALKPYGHAIQPNIDDVIQKIIEYKEKYNINKIFIATEDLCAYEKFKQKFGDMIIDNPQYKIETKQSKRYLSEIINDESTIRKDHSYKLGKEYLRSIYILSKCKYFIGGRTYGTIAVYLL